MTSPEHILAAAHFGENYTQRPYDSAGAIDLRELVCRLESLNVRPKTQPAYPTSEASAVEAWRRQVSDRIRCRMAQYHIPVTLQDQVPLVSIGKPRTELLISHEALSIPEILDRILELGGPQLQITAWEVCRFWRRSASVVIGSQQNPFRISRGDPVEYGQPLSDNSAPQEEPSAAEVDEFCEEVQQGLEKRARRRPKHMYFPARLTQYEGLPNDLRTQLNELNMIQYREFRSTIAGSLTYGGGPVPQDAPSNRYWLDFSQFCLNPYFNLLFNDRATQQRGRYYVELRPGAGVGNLVIDHTEYPPALLQSLGRMCVTQPPCKALGIYQSQDSMYLKYRSPDRRSNVRLLTRLHNNDGVRVDELIAAMEAHAQTLLATWINRAEGLTKQAGNGHWQEDIWTVPGTPRFELLLDASGMGQDYFDEEQADNRFTDPENTMLIRADGFDLWEFLGHPRSLEGHITRHCYMWADGWRKDREAEWVPEEMMEPMRSTIRYPINWDT
jgi:hypothetical protein